MEQFKADVMAWGGQIQIRQEYMVRYDHLPWRYPPEPKVVPIQPKRRSFMKRVVAFVLSVLGGVAIAQQAPRPTPDLSTSDKVALNTLERAKQDAEAAYKQAVASETTIFAEWKALHPCFHVNPTTFAVEADPKPAAQPKSAAKEPVK